jgi:hypothetical protein
MKAVTSPEALAYSQNTIWLFNYPKACQQYSHCPESLGSKKKK